MSWARMLSVNAIKELFGQYRPALFDLPIVSQAPNLVVKALQHCHQVEGLPVVK